MSHGRHIAIPFVFLSLLFASCEERVRPTIAQTSPVQDLPDQESWNATITFSDSGRTVAIVHAGHIAMFATRQFTLLDSGIKVDFYDERERHTSTLTARSGKVDDMTHDLDAYENVIVVSDSGTTLKTEKLYWSNSRRKIYTKEFVEITSPTETIHGRGFESDQSLRHYSIFEATGQARTDE